MSEIIKLVIENFQSHRKTELKPAPAGKLTVIVGPSDSGKTAILRALKWLYYNRPQGSDFTRVGANMVRVILELENNKGWVARQRSASTNRYTLSLRQSNKAGKIGLVTLEGFGNDVPLEVQELTGVRQTMIGDMPLNLNLAEQLDGPFLGSSISDAVRARVLGKLAGTEEVDQANKQLGTDLYRRNQELKQAKAEVERLAEELKQFKRLPRLKEMVEQLGQLIEGATEGINRVRRLRAIATELRDRQDQVKWWQIVWAKVCRVDDAEELKAKIDVKIYRRARMAGVQGLLECSLEEKGRAVKVLQRYECLENASASACDVDRGLSKRRELCRLQDLLYQAEDTKSEAEDVRDKLSRKIGWAEIDLAKGSDMVLRMQALIGIFKPLHAAEFRADANRRMAVVAENELVQFVGAYRDTLLLAGQCPTCGSEIDPGKFKGVI